MYCNTKFTILSIVILTNESVDYMYTFTITTKEHPPNLEDALNFIKLY